MYIVKIPKYKSIKKRNNTSIDIKEYTNPGAYVAWCMHLTVYKKSKHMIVQMRLDMYI